MVATIVGIVISVIVVAAICYAVYVGFDKWTDYKRAQYLFQQGRGQDPGPFQSPIKIKHLVFGVVGLFGLIAGAVIVNSFYTVEAGTKAIVLHFGEVDKIQEPGLHWRMPIAQRIVIINTKTLKAHAPADAGTKDLQMVNTEVALNYHVDPSRLTEIFSKVGLDVEEKVISPRIQETVKAVVAKYSAEQLLSMRESVKTEIANMLRRSVAEYYITVEDIQITNFKFSQSFNAAIEAKQTAEQEAMKAENDLKRIEVEARQKIAMAEAEAEQIRIQAEAIQKQGGKEYVQLKMIEKWDGKMPTVVGDGKMMLMITPQQ